jgi:hypothetical protein
MTQIWIQKAFYPVRAYLPRWISDPVRSLGTALLTPILFSWRTGHFRSSFKKAAVSKSGTPLPWYTYPCIDFLKNRSFEKATVLEFGAGQSTLWWAQKATRVVALEGDQAWLEELRGKVPQNVELHLVSVDSPLACVDSVNQILGTQSSAVFDVVVIDGLWRYEMIDIAARVVNRTGIIICDNAEGYGFYEGFKDRDFFRVDFFGNVPGVVLPHCTCIYFRPGASAFDAVHPIPVIVKDG